MAALIYQHRTAERDRAMAAAMRQLVAAELTESASPSGTQRARVAASNDDVTELAE